MAAAIQASLAPPAPPAPPPSAPSGTAYDASGATAHVRWAAAALAPEAAADGYETALFDLEPREIREALVAGGGTPVEDAEGHVASEATVAALAELRATNRAKVGQQPWPSP